MLAIVVRIGTDSKPVLWNSQSSRLLSGPNTVCSRQRGSPFAFRVRASHLWVKAMILNVRPENLPAPESPLGRSQWGRLRHLFVESLSDSSDFSRRVVMLDPTNGNAAVEAWEDLEFPENLQLWIDRYQQVGERSIYLWRWCLFAVDLMTLSTVDVDERLAVRDTKFLIGMFNCLIDDVADQAHNHRFVQSLLTLTRGGTPTGETTNESRLAGFVTEVWEEIWRRASQLPRFFEFQHLLAFDLRQLCTTVEHSDLTSQLPELVNRIEHDLYSSHGMMVTVAATVDLMASSEFDRKDLGGLRSVLWHAESMARIGNMISTWEREIADSDFSSGVFMEAVWQGVVLPEDLRMENEVPLVRAIIASQIEGDFLRRWESHRTHVRELGGILKSIDIEDYIGRLDRLIESEIFSHGQK